MRTRVSSRPILWGTVSQSEILMQRMIPSRQRCCVCPISCSTNPKNVLGAIAGDLAGYLSKRQPKKSSRSYRARIAIAPGRKNVRRLVERCRNSFWNQKNVPGPKSSTRSSGGSKNAPGAIPKLAAAGRAGYEPRSEHCRCPRAQPGMRELR